jgi:hypothetical protein
LCQDLPQIKKIKGLHETDVRIAAKIPWLVSA